mgnify:CR=1 FL=1
MTLGDFRTLLDHLEALNFVDATGQGVPAHFHITEVGQLDRFFIDCGGTERKESVVNFQLFTATDYDHRLSAQKLRTIIELSEEKLGMENLPIEVEYQGDTIGKYGLEFQDGVFVLTATQTDCLAKDKCGIPEEKPRIRLSAISAKERTCTPGSGCC